MWSINKFDPRIWSLSSTGYLFPTVNTVNIYSQNVFTWSRYKLNLTVALIFADYQFFILFFPVLSYTSFLLLFFDRLLSYYKFLQRGLSASVFLKPSRYVNLQWNVVMINVWVRGRKTIICADDSKEIRKWKKKYFITQICIYLTLTYIESPI